MTQTKIDRIIESMKKWETPTTERKIANRLKKEETLEVAQRNQKPVKRIVVNVEWKRSTTWGNCPTATAQIEFIDGTSKRTTRRYYASGCGYDKESTVVAELLNDYLKYKLWALEGHYNDNDDRSIKPYGIRLSFDYAPYFEGGVGMSCYYAITTFLSGTMKQIASGSTFTVYEFQF